MADNLVANIKTYCRSAGISVSQLEHSLGFSPGLVSRWQRSSPALDKIISTAAFLGVSVGTLIGETSPDYPTKQHLENVKITDNIISRTQAKEMDWDEYDAENSDINILCKEDIVDSGYEENHIYVHRIDADIIVFSVDFSEITPNLMSLKLYTLPIPYTNPEIISDDTCKLLLLLRNIDTSLFKRISNIRHNMMRNFLSGSSTD